VILDELKEGKVAIINSKELGTNCWSAHRFCGGRCQRVMRCNYPEKATCKAVQSEIDYLNNYYATELNRLQGQHTRALEALKCKVEKNLSELV